MSRFFEKTGIFWLMAVLLLGSTGANIAAESEHPKLDVLSSGNPSLAPEAVHDWYSRVSADIRASEYHLSWTDRPLLADVPPSWQAPNREHGFRTYFTETGIRLISRTETAPSWVLGLALLRWGREGAFSAVEPATPWTDRNRAIYAREGLDEWYVNDERGVEQGFTIWNPPPVGGDRLFVDLALSGTLEMVLSDGRQSIAFASPDGVRRVRYGELLVTDARGDRLRAWFEGLSDAEGPGLRIVVEDAEAVYPITIDPLATDPAWTDESDQAGAHFGYALAGAGDLNLDGFDDVIVGAPDFDGQGVDGGRAFAYLGSADGLTLYPFWTADGPARSSFGFSVGAAGRFSSSPYPGIIVGAPHAGANDQGAAYAYLFNGSTLTLHYTYSMGLEDDYLGWAVGTAGDLNGDGYGDVFVSAPGFDYVDGEWTHWDIGAVYIEYGTAQGLNGTARPHFTSSGGPCGPDYGGFGSTAGTAGDVNGDGYSDLLVGEGCYWLAHICYGGPSGCGRFENRYFPGISLFGWTVATAGDVNGDGYSDVIVGAREGQPVSLFAGSSSGLSESWVWQSSGGLGPTVAPAGDVNGDGFADFAIGTPAYGEEDEGRVSVYYGNRDWSGVRTGWTKDGSQPGAGFGSSIATAGDVNGDGYSDLLVGAPSLDGGQIDEGRALLYEGGPGGLEGSSHTMLAGQQAEAEFGYSVAPAGDVNGDGYGDVIVGAPLYQGAGANEGRVFVYNGSETGLSSSVAWQAAVGVPSARFGLWVAGAGDLNGDGFGDIAVGAPYYTNGQTDEGKAFSWYGSASGLGAPGTATNADFAVESNVANSYLGYRMGAAGDINGDGYGDLFVTVPYWDDGQTDEGSVRVWYGAASGVNDDSPADWTAYGDQTGSLFGIGAAGAGDVNGDGYSDLIVGSYKYDRAYTDEGAAFLWLGSAAGLGTTGTPGNADWAYYGGQASGQLGWSVASAGDVNGNGRCDAIVGHHGYDGTYADEGRALVFYGTATGLNASPNWTRTGGQQGAMYGWCVASAGDVNGDGYSDIAVGAMTYDMPDVDEGFAAVYHGSAAGPASSASWSGQGGQGSARYGRSVASAGDVDGDGFGDLIVGVSGYDIGSSTDAGQVRLYYGNQGRGRTLAPRQLRMGTTMPIAPLGVTGDVFDTSLLMVNPFGRSDVVLEREVKALGSNFDGTATLKTAPFDNERGAVHQVSNTLPATDRPYHWRLRILYDSPSSPFQSHGRWITMPTNGWNEADLLATLDIDHDGNPDTLDNCVSAYNPAQEDSDNDSLGDACDPCTDTDGDGWGNPGFPTSTCSEDCRPEDSSVWSAPSDPRNLIVTRAAFQNLAWQEPEVTGSTTVRYDVLASERAHIWNSPLVTCVESDGVDLVATAGVEPPPGSARYYLVRAEGPCGSNMGTRSDGTPRIGRACP